MPHICHSGTCFPSAALSIQAHTSVTSHVEGARATCPCVSARCCCCCSQLLLLPPPLLASTPAHDAR
jgi:hypothetical protein